MKLRPILSPNLPKNQVRIMAVSEKYSKLAEQILSLGIEPLIIPSCDLLAEPVASHPDMLLHHPGGDTLVYTDYDSDLTKQLSKLPFSLVRRERLPQKNYPKDVGLNALSLGNYFIGRLDTIDPTLRKLAETFGRRSVSVHQGYVKCSCCPVTETAVITSDPSIAKALKEQGFDVLLVGTKGILLEGYDCGFIGGCSGKISPDEMLFTGSLFHYPQGEEIKGFLKKQGVSYRELYDGPLLDIGSLLPLCEEISG